MWKIFIIFFDKQQVKLIVIIRVFSVSEIFSWTQTFANYEMSANRQIMTTILIIEIIIDSILPKMSVGTHKTKVLVIHPINA